jgi:glycosyltransferase involved in cell wall biosynthesis
MLKIAHISNVVDGRSNSGTARVAREIISEISLSNKAHQYLIHFDPSDDPIYSLPNVTEILIPTVMRGYASRFRAFVKFWIKWRMSDRHFKFDVVHWHSSRVYPLFFVIPSRVTIITLYDAGQRILKGVNTFSTQIFYWNLRVCQHFIDKILASTSMSGKDLVNIAKFPQGKVGFLHHGTRFGAITASPVAELQVPEEFYVCVSRWQPHKNVSKLIEAVKILNDLGQVTCPIILVGKPVGEFTEPLDLIEAYKVSDHFIILSDLNDSQLAYLFDRATLNIFPSLHEGFGLSVLEGMSRGCPPVVHFDTATSEVAGEFGHHIDMNSARELANLLENRPTKDSTTSSNLIRYAADHYNWTKLCSELIITYENALKAKR